MKIAILSGYDPQNTRSGSSWPNTITFIAQVLQRHCGEVSYIRLSCAKEELIGRILHKGSRFLIKKNFLYGLSFLLAKKYAEVAKQRLKGQSFDIIVAPCGAPAIAFLETDIPIVLVEDATFAVLHDYYPAFSNLLERSIREANIIMDLAIKKASLLVYPSAWAAQSAIEDYHADKQKVHFRPFGANFETIPPREIVEERKKSDCCKLLFVGADWQRKGGDIAFETLLKLEEMGIQAELIVCGCTPPHMFSHERMTVIPFLDKSDERQRKELEQLYLTSDFLLLPTRADCTPMVLCEANAFGLPVVTTHTGGVPEVVRDGENGFVLPYSARGAAYAEVIAQIYWDNQRYTELVRTSRATFDERLNWDAWGVAMKKLFAELLNCQPETALL